MSPFAKAINVVRVASHRLILQEPLQHLTPTGCRWHLWIAHIPPTFPSNPPNLQHHPPSSLPTTSLLPDTDTAALAAGLCHATALPSNALTPLNYAAMEKQERSYTSDCTLYLQASILTCLLSSYPPIDPITSTQMAAARSQMFLAQSFSPSSTEESSSGERTIQMSASLEDSMVPPGGESSEGLAVVGIGCNAFSAIYSNSKATLTPSDGTALLSQRLAKPIGLSSPTTDSPPHNLPFPQPLS
ncbi:hypothetical protein BKA70DRAFT_1433383 [Coprinopsis sp. MPI-PUGE-AT-0042]|nr:hypothetical protein BKA70DRAFT_1433383 [Coprinopsis sp. MPI-PUGE-AT-0042]